MRLGNIRWLAFPALLLAACGGGAASGDDDDSPGPATSTGIAQAGTLTAGAWDDNLNFDYYQSYLATTERSGLLGLPLVPRADRRVVTVVGADGRPVAGAMVRVRAGTQLVLDTPTAADGRVILFPTWSGVAGQALEISVTAGDAIGTATLAAGAAEAEVIVGEAGVLPVGVDVAFVIDTTGSMGDELDYLKAEFNAIAASLAERFPGVDQRWALIVYRDKDDTYVTRTFDFSSDRALFQLKLAAQFASGGADYPEVPERALTEAGRLSWRGGAVARLAFLVADAPHHAGRESVLIDAIARARTLGVRIYPIAASGSDALVEYSFRTAAQLTGGRYLFLTDDSGVGGAHEEPTLPCYHVTSLGSAIRRMIAMELTGEHLSPDAAEVLRTGGDPSDGRCTLEDGSQVALF